MKTQHTRRDKNTLRVPRDFLASIFSSNWYSWDPDSGVKINSLNNLISRSYFSFNFFCRCEILYNGRGFFRCGIQWKRFFPLWDTMEEVFSVVGYNGRGFFPFVGYNERGFFPCGIQRKRFFFRCGIQRKRFCLLWDRMEKNDTTNYVSYHTSPI